MQCAEFLELYSDYRDGLLQDGGLERSMLRHLLSCPHCMCYDARVARGVTALRAFSDLEPSAGFRAALDGRLATSALQEAEPVTPGPAGVMVGLMVATAIALLFWAGQSRTADQAPQAVATHEIEPVPRPLPAVVANPGAPFVSFANLSVPAFDREFRTSGVRDAMLTTSLTSTR